MTYLIPTSAGVYFLFTNVMILFIGLVYNNNSILLIGFILFTIFLISMIYTHFNLSGIVVDNCEFISGFVGEHQGLKYTIDNQVNAKRHALNLALGKGFEIPKIFMREVAEKQYQKSEKTFSLLKRGKYNFLKIKVFTTYPFGLFYAWVIFDTDITGYVYPELKGQNLHEKLKTSLREVDVTGQKDDLGEFREHKKYSVGESLKKIDWKIYAKRDSLMSKVYAENEIFTWTFSYASLMHLDEEEKISQLTKWVVECFALNQRWQLKLPGFSPVINRGDDFYFSCLQALATFGTQEGHD